MYKIVFQREDSAAVTMIFENNTNNPLPNGKTAKVEASWTYNSEEFSFTVGDVENRKEIIVGRNQEITFNITVGKGVRVEKCTSHLPGNHTPTGTYPVPGNGGQIKIIASATFELVIKIRPDGLLVNWSDCKDFSQGEVSGYDRGWITYTKPNGNSSTTDELNKADTKRLVKDGTPVTLKIEGLHSSRYVDYWLVNGKYSTDEPNKFKLNDDKTELTILKAETDYTVEVQLRKKRVNIKIF